MSVRWAINPKRLGTAALDESVWFSVRSSQALTYQHTLMIYCDQANSVHFPYFEPHYRMYLSYGTFRELASPPTIVSLNHRLHCSTTCPHNIHTAVQTGGSLLIFMWKDAG